MRPPQRTQFQAALACVPREYPGRARLEAALTAAAASRQSMGGATFATPAPQRLVEARLALEAALAAYPPPPAAAWPAAALRHLGGD